MSTQADPSVEYLRSEIEKEVRALYDAKFAKEIAEFKAHLEADNTKAVEQAIAEFRKSQKPPDKEELQMLLSQEYLSFKVKLPDPKDETKDKEFVIGELPQRAEKLFYKKFKEQIIPHASDLGALTFELLEGDVGKKITSLLESFEPAFDLLADACVLILDPRKKEELSVAWIQDNLSSYRQWNIIMAQVQVNRLRDLFSQISRNSSGIPTTLGANIRN